VVTVKTAQRAPNRILISDLLHTAGYAVMEARDGAEALAHLHGAARLPAAILVCQE